METSPGQPDGVGPVSRSPLTCAAASTRTRPTAAPRLRRRHRQRAGRQGLARGVLPCGRVASADGVPGESWEATGGETGSIVAGLLVISVLLTLPYSGPDVVEHHDGLFYDAQRLEIKGEGRDEALQLAFSSDMAAELAPQEARAYFRLTRRRSGTRWADYSSPLLPKAMDRPGDRGRPRPRRRRRPLPRDHRTDRLGAAGPDAVPVAAAPLRTRAQRRRGALLRPAAPGVLARARSGHRQLGPDPVRAGPTPRVAVPTKPFGLASRVDRRGDRTVPDPAT